jgi:hypothetical protein
LSTNFKKEKPKIKLFPRRAEECKTEHFPGAWNERAGDLLGEGNTKLLALPSSSTILPRSRRRSRRAVATSHSILLPTRKALPPVPTLFPFEFLRSDSSVAPQQLCNLGIPPPGISSNHREIFRAPFGFCRTDLRIRSGWRFPAVVFDFGGGIFVGANASMCLLRMRARVFFSSPDGFWVDSAVEP